MTREDLETLLAWALAAAILVGATLAWIGQDVPSPALPDLRPPAPALEAPVDPEAAWLAMDAALLADVALGEDPGALGAVMWTVLNRRRGQEPLELTIQRGQAFGTVREGRFWPSWDRVPGRRWSRWPGAWEEALETAWDVLLGLHPDPTGGARFFHRRGTWTPPWAPHPDQWVLLGQHYFYDRA